MLSNEEIESRALPVPWQPAAGNLHLVLINCLHQLPPGVKVRALFEACMPFLDGLGDIGHLLQLQVGARASSLTSRVRGLSLNCARAGGGVKC